MFIRPVLTSPLVSLALLVLGSSFFTTFITVRMNLENVSENWVGMLHATYNMGLLIASVSMEGLICRIGHIRAFAVFASLVSVTILLQALFPSLYVWMLARFVAGISLSAMYVTIESWLLCESTAKTRGRILGIYMLTLYASQAAGQYFLYTIDIKTLDAFIVAGCLCTLSVIPVTLTYRSTPKIHTRTKLKVYRYLKDFPYAFWGCHTSGMIMGAIYSFTPNFAQDFNLSIADTMSVTIVGGFVLQWPLGKLSDLFGRKKIIFMLSLAAVIPAMTIALYPHNSTLVLISSFLLGAFIVAIYPICVCDVCDNISEEKIISATGAMLFAYGTGLVIGPLAAAKFIVTFSSRSLYVFITFVVIALVCAGIFNFIRSILIIKRQRRGHDSVDFVYLARTTLVANKLNPHNPVQDKTKSDNKSKDESKSDKS